MGKARRCFVDLPIDAQRSFIGQIVTLDDTSAHHLRDVTRTSKEAHLIVISRSSGDAFEGTIIEISPQVRVKLETSLPRIIHRSRVHTLALAASKGDTIDLVIEKATELGVSEFIVWHAQRSVPSKESLDKKIPRWSKIAESASLQCGRYSIPSITTAASLTVALKYMNAGITESGHIVYLSLLSEARQFRELQVHGMISVCVGPEGDFDEEEARILRDAGAVPCSLGPLTLRCETAAIAGVSMSNALFGFLSE